MKKKVVLFLPMLIALLDVVIEFAIPTNEVINTNGVHYFGYLMLIIAGIYLILGKDEYCCVFGFSDTLVEDHPEVAKNYVKALSMACDFISENPVEAAKLCYENGYVADEDYEFNGKLLESYRYKFNYEDAKASFVDVTKDLNDLGIITLNKSADELADETFVNAGQVK